MIIIDKIFGMGVCGLGNQLVPRGWWAISDYPVPGTWFSVWHTIGTLWIFSGWMSEYMNGYMIRLCLAVVMYFLNATDLRTEPRKLRMRGKRGLLYPLRPSHFSWAWLLSEASFHMPAKAGHSHATPSEPTEVRVGVSRPWFLRGICRKQLLAQVCWEGSRAEEMSKGEWDNQALAIKTATHSSLSDSTREIFQTVSASSHV